MKQTTYAVVDLETTGHSPQKGDRIIQIAIVFVRNRQVIDRYTTFLNPNQSIPPFISQLTSITDQDVEGAPTFEEVAADIAVMLEDTVFVAHNIAFDLSFLRYEWERCNVTPWEGKTIDTVELAKIAFPSAMSYRLQDLAEQLHLPLQNAHRADDDAYATAHLLTKCYEKLQHYPTATLQQLHRRSFSMHSNIAQLFYDMLKNKKTETLDYATYKGIPYKWTKEQYETGNVTSKYEHDEEQILQAFHQIDETYEKRPAQLAFMKEVWNAFVQKQEVVVEVPTGIGKTLGYLYPAAMFAIERNKTIVLSTYTNYLVDQLYEREMNKVEKMVGQRLRIAILKGRHHYFSFEKFLRLLETTDHSYDETLTIMQLFVWLMETDVGDVEELNVSGGGHLLLQRVRKDSMTEGVERDVDFHSRALHRAHRAHIVLTNHAWLLSSEESATLLKRAGGCVIDEAHQMIDAALQSKEIVFSYTYWKYVVGQIHNEGERDLLPNVLTIRRSFESFSTSEKEKLDEARDQFIHAYDRAVERLIQIVFDLDETSDRLKTVLLPKSAKDEPVFLEVSRRLLHYIQSLYSLLEPCEKRRTEWSKRDKAYIETWKSWVETLEEKLTDWISFFAQNDGVDEVITITLDQKGLPGSLKMIKRPLYAASAIRQKIQAYQQSIVWTSGTMAVQNHPTFITAQLGIEHVPFRALTAPDTFYEGARLWIVEDMPLIQEVEEEAYIEAVVDAIVQTAYAVNGRFFVLFTSQKMLKAAYELLHESELLDDYILLAQGVAGGSRMKMLRTFQNWERSILFGTNSFWEGVDLPGQSLQAVVVVRLPFSSPADPIYRKRAEIVKRQGKHTFYDYALPEAMIRLRQGFGRLIRAADDRGSFIVLDRRIETKPYGKSFIQALPSIPLEKVKLSHMVERLESWYTEERMDEE